MPRRAVEEATLVLVSRWHPKWCKRCPASVYTGATISARGLCSDCGRLAILENVDQLQAHSGPLFEWWRVRCLQAFGVQLTAPQVADDRPPTEVDSLDASRVAA